MRNHAMARPVPSADDAGYPSVRREHHYRSESKEGEIGLSRGWEAPPEPGREKCYSAALRLPGAIHSTPFMKPSFGVSAR